MLSCGRFELRRLICDREGIDDISQLSGHDDWKIGEVLIDTMIRDAILREIIGTDLLTAIACANLCETIGSLGLRFFLLFLCIETSLQDRYSLDLVLQL